MSPPTEHERRFAEYLRKLADDENRAALAALRRGLGKRPGEVSDPCPYVDPWLAPNASAGDEEAHYLVAALFGLHQHYWPAGDGERGPTNLGASLATLQESGSKAAVERRFIALLNAHREDMPQHLRHLVGLLKAKDVAVDWAQLLHDVRGWDHPRRAVQREWARAFWRQASAGEASPALEGSPSGATNGLGEGQRPAPR